MANYKTHFVASMITGAGAAYYVYVTSRLDLVHSSIVFAAGAISGFIPDLDSDTGKPINVLMNLLSVIIPIIIFNHTRQYVGMNNINIILYFIAVYSFLNYFVFMLIKKITAHRGIMHSIPFCMLSSGIVFLALFKYGQPVALYSALSCFLGSVSHLVLDELSAFKFKFGLIPVPKASIGTALKFKSDSIWATLVVYLLLISIYIFIFQLII